MARSLARSSRLPSSPPAHAMKGSTVLTNTARVMIACIKAVPEAGLILCQNRWEDPRAVRPHDVFAEDRGRRSEIWLSQTLVGHAEPTLTGSLARSCALRRRWENRTARGPTSRGAEPCPGSDALFNESPLAALNGENSRAKVQNVREDSSAVSWAANEARHVG